MTKVFLQFASPPFPSFYSYRRRRCLPSHSLIQVNPQVSELIQIFDGTVESNLSIAQRINADPPAHLEEPVEVPRRKRPPPPLIPISAVLNYTAEAGVDPALLDQLVMQEEEAKRTKHDDDDGDGDS